MSGAGGLRAEHEGVVWDVVRQVLQYVGVDREGFCPGPFVRYRLGPAKA
ncbi:hypothetical protein [Streptomyces sp. NPDC101166]